MSLLNGLTGLGAGLNKFAGQQAASMEDETRAPLVNVAPEPKSLTPTYAELSAAHGGNLDSSTLDRAHQVFQGLVQRGMDPTTAIGFAANSVAESGANPAVSAGDQGVSHQLLQWNGPRWDAFTQKYGNSTKLDDALDHIMSEINGPEAKAWQAIQQAQQDPASRAAAITQYYERPADTRGEIAKRSQIATQLAHHFAGLAANQGEQE